MKSPYSALPEKSYWRTAVAKSKSLVPPGIYTPKWPISRSDAIATAGSCFAQHIGRSLISADFNILDVEPPPPQLPCELHSKYGFSIYSARYGNIYTTRQLIQLAREAFGKQDIAPRSWQDLQGRFFDAFRPGVEPEGLETADEVANHRHYHLLRVRKLLETCDVFIFTMGLTEAWQESATKLVFPTAPGTIAGSYDEKVYNFKNFRFDDIRTDLLQFHALLSSRKGKHSPRILLTVSPVPLTATATNDHVMVATVHSKAILRAVAGELAAEHEDFDYFPSYEIVSSPWSDEKKFEPNLRTVTPSTVLEVMKTFMAAHAVTQHAQCTRQDPRHEPGAPAPRDASAAIEEEVEDNVVCEEALLDAFSSVATVTGNDKNQ